MKIVCVCGHEKSATKLRDNLYVFELPATVEGDATNPAELYVLTCSRCETTAIVRHVPR